MKNETVEFPSPARSKNKIRNGRAGFFGSPVALIRLCAILFFGLTAGHISAYPFAHEDARGGKQLVDSMKYAGFEFLGERSTYWNLYFGWGIFVTVLLLTLALVLWLLSDLARLAPRRIGAITAIISSASFAGAYLSYRFFFIPPVLLLLIIGLVMLKTAIQLLRKA